MTTLEQKDTRQEIMSLIDGLPQQELHAVKRYIQYVRDLQDPFLRSLAAAPWDDEPLTEEDRIAIAEAKEDITAGRVISAEELKKELGI
jgi:hypothetical protein